MSEAIFPAAVAAVLEWEGGYVNDPQDPGGETNFGISKASYPDLDIRNLTRDEAVAIYHRDYWVAPDYVSLPDQIGAKMLDMGVNMGPRTANRCLQRACNHMSATLAVDGVLGPLSRAAVTHQPVNVLLATLRVEAANYYREIVADNPAMVKYLRGWLRRAGS